MNLGKIDLHGILLEMAEKAAKERGISLTRLAFLIGRSPHFFLKIKEGGSCRVDLWQDAYRVLSNKRLFAEREAEAKARETEWRRERQNEDLVR